MRSINPISPDVSLSQAPSRGLRFWLRKIITAAISIALLSYVLYTADWQHVRMLLHQLHPAWLVASLATVPVMVGLSVWKWQILLASRGYHPGFGLLMRIYITGQFYNYLLPTSSGGDVVRAVLLHRRIHHAKAALGSIIVERFTGLAVLIVIVLAAIAMAPGLWRDPWLLLLVLAGSAMACGAMLIIISRRLTRLAQRLLGRFAPAQKFLAKLLSFQHSLWEYRQYPRALAAAMALSAGFHIAAVLGVWFACLAFGESVSLLSQFIVVPLVLIVTLLPITLGGIGLWEWASLALRVRDLLWTVGGYALVLLWPARQASAKYFADTADKSMPDAP